MKNLSELWKEFDKKKGKLTPEGIEDLKWHIENDRSPYEAIAAARDMIIETVDRDRLEQAILPIIAKHFDHNSGDIRQVAVGTVVGICGAANYGEKTLLMARFDPDGYVKTTALLALGWIMNTVDRKLAHKMADHLYTILTSHDKEKYDHSDRDAAESSVLISMEVYYPEWGTVNFQEVWGKFLKKYNLPEKEVVKVEKR